jgi:hypothetical protein
MTWRVLVLLLAAAAVLFGCAARKPAEEITPAASDVTSTVGERPLDSLALIDQAVRAGRIDYSTGLLYKVYVMFEPESLPLDYKSQIPAKCGTPLIEEVQRNWDRLTPEQRAEIQVYIQPVKDPRVPDTQLDDVTRDRLDHEQEKLD